MRCLAPLLFLLPAACGYTTGFQSVSPDVRTVAIEVVRNETFRQRLERPLTRQLYRDLNVYTSYWHAPLATADAILKVRLLGIRNQTLVQGQGAPVAEGAIDAVVEVQLVARRSGHVLMKRRIRDIAEFRVPIGEDQESARAELVSDLSRKIMLALEGDF